MERTEVCVVGGGPAGMVLGLLLARAGVEVTVLEKHADFLRDFRGDTVHPSTIQLLDELGLGERFAALPQRHVSQAQFPVGDGETLTVGDFTKLDLPHPYIAMVPQWDLLGMLAEAAAKESTFTLLRSTECTGLISERGRVAGVRYRRADGGAGELRATLTVAADGRHSVVRDAARLRPVEQKAPYDAWWFRLPTEEPTETFTPAMAREQFVALFPRDGYIQAAYIAGKGRDAEFRAAGIGAFRERLRRVLPGFATEIGQLHSMDEVRHLEVRVNRLRTWHRNGLLCIGDAAHAMSPIGGVGINLAVQDAVGAATLLAEPLRAGRLRRRDLARVQARRWLPTVAVQSLQRLIYTVVVAPVMQGRRGTAPAPLLGALRRFPRLSIVPAYLIGVGLRPEHAPRWARPAPR